MTHLIRHAYSLEGTSAADGFRIKGQRVWRRRDSTPSTIAVAGSHVLVAYPCEKSRRNWGFMAWLGFDPMSHCSSRQPRPSSQTSANNPNGFIWPGWGSTPCPVALAGSHVLHRRLLRNNPNGFIWPGWGSTPCPIAVAGSHVLIADPCNKSKRNWGFVAWPGFGPRYHCSSRQPRPHRRLLQQPNKWFLMAWLGFDPMSLWSSRQPGPHRRPLREIKRKLGFYGSVRTCPHIQLHSREPNPHRRPLVVENVNRGKLYLTEGT
jgi:hypothetical protein